nr:MAG TPA: hypothetical protein [Caudoviricetes sp.]
MEPIGFFTSPADLPADAMYLMAPDRSEAARILTEMAIKRTGRYPGVSVYNYGVPNFFKMCLPPAAGAAVDPDFTPSFLYCYLNEAEFEQAFESLYYDGEYDDIYDLENLDELD